MYRLANWWMRLNGWTIEGTLPRQQSFVATGAPHTSNWDFVVFLGVLHHFGLRARFLGKHSLFRGPVGIFMRRWGGIPVDRNKAGGAVDSIASAIRAATPSVLVIAPEGTRDSVGIWKSGFYQIALAADIPLVPASVDHGRRIARLGPSISLSGNAKLDMDQVRAFYQQSVVDPDRLTAIRIREEDSE